FGRVFLGLGGWQLAKREPDTEADLSGSWRSRIDYQVVGLQLFRGRTVQERQAVVLLFSASLGKLRDRRRHLLFQRLRQIVRAEERAARRRRSIHSQRAASRHLADDVQDEAVGVQRPDRQVSRP